MDTNNVPATSTETVAKISAFNHDLYVTVKDENGNAIMREDNTPKKVKTPTTFVAVNDIPATKLDMVDFGDATSIVVAINEFFGPAAVNSVIKNALRKTLTVSYQAPKDEEVNDEELKLYINTIHIPLEVDKVKEAFEFYKMLNA